MPKNCVKKKQQNSYTFSIQILIIYVHERLLKHY